MFGKYIIAIMIIAIFSSEILMTIVCCLSLSFVMTLEYLEQPFQSNKER
jgi:hypothetical protein